MPRLKSDLLAALAARDGKLALSGRCRLTVLMASQGYPGTYEKGHVITGRTRPPTARVTFSTPVRQRRHRHSGGRVLNVTALGKTGEAQARAYPR
jgi:phosphoribosylamine--glycine ligase